MATSLSLSNFLSFLLPSKTTTAPPKLTPTQISTPSSPSPTHFQTQKPRDGLVPLVAQDAHSASDLSSVICPSLAYSNTLFFSAPYNVQLVVDDDEPEDRLIGRFRRDVMRAGVMQESRRRQFHENKQEAKKRKNRDAAKRNRARRPFTRFPDKDEEGTTDANDDEDDENWDHPQGYMPY